MKPEIDLLDLFSGAGGFAYGLQEAGFTIKNHYFSEIDKHAIANYKNNFKNSTYVGSVTDVRGAALRPDIVTFGSPCQDFSLAGKRAGMGGSRSSLISQAIRIIIEAQPSVFIWENVKGAFSSNGGADFWAIIAAFANIGGYRLEWQLLNTKWVLPQNRERIYLVGHATGRSKFGVFPFSENDRLLTGFKNHKPQTQHSTAVTTSIDRAESTFIQVPKTAKCLTGGGNSGGLHSDMDIVTIKQLNQNPKFGHATRQQDRVYDPAGLMASLPTHCMDKCNIVVKPVLTPNRKEKHQNGRRFKDNGEDAFTLNCQDQQGVLLNDAIRRLTEIECERLQGFPDDWTKYGDYDGVIKKIAKTQRYKLMGNAVTTKVVTMIGKRIQIKN